MLKHNLRLFYCIYQPVEDMKKCKKMIWDFLISLKKKKVINKNSIGWIIKLFGASFTGQPFFFGIQSLVHGEMCDRAIVGGPFLQMNQKSRRHLFDSLKQMEGHAHGF